MLFSGNKTQSEILYTKVSRSTDRIKVSRNTPKDGAMVQQPNAEKHVLERCCSPEQDAKRDTSHKGTSIHPSFSIDLKKGTNYLNKEIISSIQGEIKTGFSIPPKGERFSTMERPTI